MFKFLSGLFSKPQPKKITGYSHWDIHALARTIAPEAWAVYDAAPEINPNTGRKKYYMDNYSAPVIDVLGRKTFTIGTNESFELAVRALLANYKSPWGNLQNDEELAAWIRQHDGKHCKCCGHPFREEA